MKIKMTENEYKKYLNYRKKQIRENFEVNRDELDKEINRLAKWCIKKGCCDPEEFGNNDPWDYDLIAKTVEEKADWKKIAAIYHCKPDEIDHENFIYDTILDDLIEEMAKILKM